MDRALDGGNAIASDVASGHEVFGKFSPDGKWIAFTGQYDGDEQVYVVPSTGGEPRQLTFYPAKGPSRRAGVRTIRFTVGAVTASAIYFRSLRDSWALPIARLYSVSIEGGPAEAVTDARSRVG